MIGTPRALARGLAALGNLLAVPLCAQTWIPVGPPGGDVRSLATDARSGHTVYLGTAGGILYRSDDAGLRWLRVEPGFPLRGMSLDELVVDARGRLFVGYWEVSGSGGGVARSDDGGRNFEVLPGIAGQSVRALAVAPSNPDILVAGALSGVFRSDDGGRVWRRISPEGHPEIRNVEATAVDPADPDVVYAGTWHLPWKTQDGGRSWRPIHTGIVDDSDIFTLTLDRRNPRRVYATACTGIYRSADAAARWAKLKGIPASSRRTRSFAQNPERPDALYAGTTEGLWTSGDSGSTWRLATRRDLVVNAIVVLPGGTILLGCDGAGVLRSGDGGRTFQGSNRGFSERLVSRVLFDRDRGRILAGIVCDRQHGGVFAARESDGAWARMGAGLEGREILTLAMVGSGILAGTDDGLYAMAAEGGWTRLRVSIDGLDAHPRVSELVGLTDRVVLAATTDGLLRSEDGGVRWERRALGAARAILALVSSSSLSSSSSSSSSSFSSKEASLALAATPLALYRSRDAGDTWEVVSGGPDESRLHGLYLLPGNDHVVFATTATGLFKSANQGRTWTRRGGGLPFSDVTGLALSSNGRTLFASDFGRGGLYRSDDAGDTWAPFPADGLPSSRVFSWAIDTSLAIDAATPPRLFAASAAGGLHVLSGVAAPAAAPGQSQ